MIAILEIVFWLSLLGLLHSYLFYPFLLRVLAAGKKNNQLWYGEQEEWPVVSVIMSVYNEEKVIRQKLDSLLSLKYPEGKYYIYIGSDCSSDDTNKIIEQYATQYDYLHFFPFQDRSGKPGVINKLSDEAVKKYPPSSDHIFLITDANVILQPQTLRHLTKHFRNDEIVIVDANMVHTGMQAEGISKAEDKYISSEVRLKHLEGIIWGKMIGPFGGCYAIRSNYFSKVPPNFLVDDFYITMKAFEMGGKAINDLDAVCYEAVSHEIKEEFRRKVRISGGNFQNLLTFKKLWWPPTTAVGFAFFSHKILRWLGPFLLLLAFLSGGLLSFSGNLIYRWLFYLLTIGTVIVPVLDFLLKSINIHVMPLRAVRYFIMMNLALFKGFINFIKGIQSNVWEPPKRN